MKASRRNLVNVLKTWVLAIGLLLTATFAKGGTITSTSTGGRWTDTGTWVGGVAPKTTDIVVIASGATVNIESATTCAGITINGTLILGGTGTKTFKGNVIINSNGVWNETGVAAINYAGNLQNDGATFTANTGMHTFTGSAKTISGASVIAIPKLTISDETTNNGTLIVSTTLAGSGGKLTNGATGILSFGGSSISPALITTASGNLVNYTGATQIVKATSYYNLILSGSGAKSIATNTSITGNLSISGATANVGWGLTISVGSLTLGGINKINGIWGSTSSSAVNKDNTYFAVTTGKITVANDTRLTPNFSGLTASQSIYSGTATVSLSGTVSAAGPVYPADGETVGVTINGVTQNATIAGGAGGFSINFNTAAIPTSGTPYAITYSYASTVSLKAAANNTTTTLIVNPSSIGGTISGFTSPICLSSGTGTMTLTGYVGTILRWERQINSGGWNNVWNGNNTTLEETPWSAGTWEYRVAIQNGSAPIAYSSVASISVDANTVAGWMSGSSAPIYEGTSTGTITLNGSTGSIVRWEKRVNSGSWTNISNTLTTYSEIPSTNGIWEYRVLVQSGSCSPLYSSIFSMTVKPVLTITLGVNPIICKNTTVALLPYTATTGSPDGYKIDFDAAANAAGFSDVNYGLPASPISINVPYGVAPGIYNGVLSVISNNPVGSSIGYPIAVTVQDNAQTSVITGDISPCQGSSQNYNVTNVNGVTYIWTFPSDWVQTGGGNTNSVTVTVGAASGDVHVIPIYPCGNGPTQTLAVAPSSLPDQPGVISGNTTVSFGTSQTYSVPNINGVTYIWSFPVGWTQTNGGTTNSVTVTVGAGSGNIQVTPSNACGNGTVQTLAISVISPIENNFLDFTNGLHGTIYATVNENDNAVLAAPKGTVFVNVGFASYGTPNGTCPTFTLGDCNALTSQSVTEGYLLGNNSATIPANNNVFGDPCYGTVKRLYILATYTEPICAETTPGMIMGTLPTGGIGAFSYLWESSTTGPSGGFVAAAGINNLQNYTPGALSQTTWYRRTVTSNGFSDVSNVLLIKVKPEIAGNTILSSQSICLGSAPTALTGTIPTGGNGTYVYLWESSITNATTGFVSASGINNGQNYTPNALTQTTWYRRIVTSGGCNDISATIQITVVALPVATFSYGGSPFPIFSGGGVAGTFSSTVGLNFVSTATGEVNLVTSTPGTYIVTNTVVALGGCGTVTASSSITISALHNMAFIWQGTLSSIWNDPNNWSTGVVPNLTNDVVIPDAFTTLYDPVLPSEPAASVKTISVKSGGILNGGTSTTLTVAGSTSAWENFGTFNAGTSTVSFTNANATIGNTTNFYNVTIATGASLTPQSESVMRIAGTLTLQGTGVLRATTLPNTIEFNGSNQTVVNPNGSPSGYYNLTLSGSGTKILSGIALAISGDFSMSGTASATVSTAMTVAGNLTISDGSILSVSPAISLTVSGTLTNNLDASHFVLQSDATGTASLIHNTTNVPATVERYMSGDAEAWHFLSSPVSAQNISGSWLPSGSYGNGTGYDLYVWNEPTSCWIYKGDITSPVNWNTVHPGSDFAIGRGYLYSVQASNPTKEFVGKLNNGSFNYGLTINSTDTSLKGFNLIGNPYPSPIDWRATSGWTRTNLVNSGGGYDMWIWNPAVNNYGVCNSDDASGVSTNSVTRYIASMQGFFVQASSAGNLCMTNSVRVLDGAGNLFKSKALDVDKVNLSVKSDDGYGSDEIQLGFGYPENKNGAMKLFSKTSSAPSLYMMSKEKYLSVLYLTTTKENPAVPLMFAPGIYGNYTISCNFDQRKFDTIMLEDRQTHHIQNMKVEKTYQFKASKTDDANRFVLYFESVKNQSDKELPGNIYTDGAHLVVDLTLVSRETDVFVYDIMGRILLQQKVQGNTQQNLILNAHKQTLVVALKNQDGSLSRKLLWGGN